MTLAESHNPNSVREVVEMLHADVIKPLQAEIERLRARLSAAEAVCEAATVHEQGRGSWQSVIHALAAWRVASGDEQR